MSQSTRQVSLLVIGAGGRGKVYSAFTKEHPERARIVGVAEPRDEHRALMVNDYSISPENSFTDWRQAAERPKFADAVLITTQDSMHVDPALAFANLGYDILLEKPMATNERDCELIVSAVNQAGILLAVCHVMRYTSYTQVLKGLIDSGVIGDIVSVQHLEPVGYWHQAHSFVRGNWRNEKESSFMLLAKSCHDLDWIRYILGSKCQSVSSFGTLKHFRKDQQPVGAADRCVDCSVEGDCPYSALKIYLKRVENGFTGWPVDVLTINPSPETILAALKTGPYGRCVYACDNDVVDNQVVNMLFDGGGTAAFTMTAFTELGHRKTRIFGTRGEIYGNGEDITHYDFLTDEKRIIPTVIADSSLLGGHGGGDYGLMDHFIDAVAYQDPSYILSGANESLETHRMVFAAERARCEHRVVDLGD